MNDISSPDYAGPTGREQPGEHWNARILREQAQSSLPIRVNTRAQLLGIADALSVRITWHEPDEQGVTAVVHGTDLDNAGFWGHDSDGVPVTYGEECQELWIELRRDGKPVAEVCLATLLAWATGLEN